MKSADSFIQIISIPITTSLREQIFTRYGAKTRFSPVLEVAATSVSFEGLQLAVCAICSR